MQNVFGTTLLVAALAMSAACSGGDASNPAVAADAAGNEPVSEASSDSPPEVFGSIVSLIPGVEIRSGGGGFLVTRDGVVFDSTGERIPVSGFEPGEDVNLYASALGLYAIGTTGASGLQDGERVFARIARDGTIMWSVPKPDGFDLGDTSIEIKTGESYLPLDAETGQVLAGAEPDVEVHLEKYPDSLTAFRGEQELWKMEIDASIVGHGYGRVALYNDGSGDVVLLDVEDGSQQNLLPTDHGDLTGCNQDGEFVTENILALECRGRAGQTWAALVRV